jgi:hypothetical protein
MQSTAQWKADSNRRLCVPAPHVLSMKCRLGPLELNTDSFPHPCPHTDFLLVSGTFPGLAVTLSRPAQSVKGFPKRLAGSGLHVTTRWTTVAHTTRPLSVAMENHMGGLDPERLFEPLLLLPSVSYLPFRPPKKGLH